MSNNKSPKQNRELILNGSIVTAILSISIPVVINSFLQTMYNLTDTYWLGHIGSDQLAAINLVSPMQNIVINFGTGITVAGSVLISHYIGAKQDKNARNMATHIFICAMIFAFLCAGICFFATPAIVKWLGADSIIFEYSKTYMQVVILDMPLLFTINVFTSIYQAQGDTVHPMYLNFLGIVINMILDPLFMKILGLGVFGAALATLLSKLPPAVIALFVLTRKKSPIHFTFKGFKFDKEKISNIVKVGLPTAIGGSTMQLGFLLMSRNVYVYGAKAMAAYGIGNKVNGLITLPATGIGSATATIVGQNMGAKQPERAKEGYLLARHMSMIFLFIGGMILSRPFISRSVVSIFTSDTEVIPMAAKFLSIMAFWCFTNGMHNATSGLFQGTGHTEVTMAIDATRLWVFRFLSLYIMQNILHMGVDSIWYCVVISNGISASILYVLYKTGLWRKSKIKL